MAGKLIPYGVVGAVETAMVLLIMRFLFDVHIAGSILLLAALSLLFLFTSLGLGLLVSTLAQSQVQAEMNWRQKPMATSFIPDANRRFAVFTLGSRSRNAPASTSGEANCRRCGDPGHSCNGRWSPTSPIPTLPN